MEFHLFEDFFFEFPCIFFYFLFSCFFDKVMKFLLTRLLNSVDGTKEEYGMEVFYAFDRIIMRVDKFSCS